MTDIFEDSALILVDLINNFDFKHGHLLSNNTVNIINNIVTLKNYFIMRKLPVIYVNDNYNIWSGNYNDVIQFCYNEKSCRIIDKISPGNNNYFISKSKYSTFYNTNLESLLNDMDIKTLVFSGIAGNVCVYFSAADGYMRNYNIIVPSDCVASNYKKDNHYILNSMSYLFNANIDRHENILI